MEIQTIDGGDLLRKNLVLYVHVQQNPDQLTGHTFMAAIYETDTFTLSGEEIPILLYTGTGNKELQKAYSCIDILFEISYQAKLGEQLAGWLLECQTFEAKSYSICIQIRYEGRSISNIVVPKIRFFPPTDHALITYPSQMVLKQVEHLPKQIEKDTLEQVN